MIKNAMRKNDIGVLYRLSFHNINRPHPLKLSNSSKISSFTKDCDLMSETASAVSFHSSAVKFIFFNKNVKYIFYLHDKRVGLRVNRMKCIRRQCSETDHRLNSQ